MELQQPCLCSQLFLCPPARLCGEPDESSFAARSRAALVGETSAGSSEIAVDQGLYQDCTYDYAKLVVIANDARSYF